MKRINLFIILLILTLLLSISCGDDNTGLFYRVSHMEEIEDNSLDNALTIGAMCELGGYYYIATGRIYRRSTSGGIWENIDEPSGYQLCFDLVTDGTRLFAAYYNWNNGDKRLFTGSGNGSWAIEEGGISGRDVGKIMIANANLFISVKNSGDDEYAIYYDAAGAGMTFTDTTIDLPDSDKDPTFFDITFIGGNYWLAAEDNVYSAGTIGGLAASIDEPPSGKEYCGIYASAAKNTIFLTSYDKKIYAYNIGITSWGIADSLSFVPNDIGEIDRGGGDIVIIIGTEGRGYMEQRFTGAIDENLLDFRWPNSGYSYASHSSYISYELQYSVITGFFNDGNDKLFALTSGGGLWRNEPNTSISDRKWGIE